MPSNAPNPQTHAQLPTGAAGVIESLAGARLARFYVDPYAGDVVHWLFDYGVPDTHFTLWLEVVQSAPAWVSNATVHISNGTFPAQATAVNKANAQHLFAASSSSKVLFLHFIAADEHEWGTTDATMTTLAEKTTYTFFKVSDLAGNFRTVTDE